MQVQLNLLREGGRASVESHTAWDRTLIGGACGSMRSTKASFARAHHPTRCPPSHARCNWRTFLYKESRASVHLCASRPWRDSKHGRPLTPAAARKDHQV